MELEVVGSDIQISVCTDDDVFKQLDPYKKIVKVKRGVYPDAVYDKLINKVVNGWRLNKIYCEELLLSKTQVNSIVKIVSYILAVTILENNPLNSINLNQNVKNFLKPLQGENPVGKKESVRVNIKKINTVDSKNVILDEVLFNIKELDKIISKSKNNNITVALFPICFEKDMEEIKKIVTYLEARCEVKYEINDIGHYNLLKYYLNIPTQRFIGGQGIACYNHLSLKFLKDELGINSLSIPMEMDSRGVIKITEDNSGYVDLRFTELSSVPVMYSRVQSDSFFEGAEFEDNIGTVFHVHQYKDLNVFIANEYFSSEECRDLEGIDFSEVIKEAECLNHPEVIRKKFNLERRLY